jgi:AraC-like DNA-binding protein
MFHLGGVGLAVFLNLLLLGKRKKSSADWVLAGWLLIMALHLLMFTFFRLKLYPQLWGIDLPLPLLHGPFLYLYTRALTGKPLPATHLAIHFALPLAFYVYLIPFILLPAGDKIFVYDHRGIGYETFLLIRAFCIPISGVLYILLSLSTLRRHRRAIVEQFSSVDQINLAWLQYLILWIAAIWVLVFIGNDDWIFGAAVVLIFFIGFFGIRQRVIFDGHTHAHDINFEKKQRSSIETQVAAPVAAEKIKYQKSGLSADTSEAVHRQLTSVMDREKYYKNSELTLVDLAERLKVAPNHLSQVINEREGKNFYDYVNSLRVREFMQIVHRPESRKLTLFALAQDCGFNSKSSFNRYFKKITGQSPSEYMDAVTASEN